MAKNTNAKITLKKFEENLNLEEKAEKLLIELSKKTQVSPRVFSKLKKVARTIADIENSPYVLEKHILEAFQYRPKDF